MRPSLSKILRVAMLLPLLSLFLGACATSTYRHCKTQPGSRDWPCDAQWRSLNTSVSGRLARITPPGAVCHPGLPQFSNGFCAELQAQWTNASWHSNNPWSPHYNDDSCLPIASSPCSATGYPAYTIEAVEAADVQAGVLFARDTGIRLVIKGTGHDYPGRSSGPNSLEIWTHRLRGVTVTPTQSFLTSDGSIASVKIAAGTQWSEIYAEAAKNGLTMVGGGDNDVGISGWMLGGGHSPVSSHYGFGADQVLQMEVVTADGKYRIVNESLNSDLFWALRGGGPSFAILLSVTVKAYPSLSGAIYIFSYNTTAASDTFYTLSARFHAQLPGLSDAGGMGYYGILPTSGNPDPQQGGTVTGGWIFPNKSSDEVETIMAPIEFTLNGSAWADDKIFKTSSILEFPDFTSLWLQNPSEAVGSDGRLGSWLLDGPALRENISSLKTKLEEAVPRYEVLVGHVVAGKGVRNVSVPGGSNAVLPAWREAYVHAVLPRSWTPLNSSEKVAGSEDLRNIAVPALQQLAPNSGAYMSEADPSNPNWREDYFGANYPRLLSIKKKWDPHGVFWCKPCVGHELWEIVNGPANESELEWGIGQSPVQICRK